MSEPRTEAGRVLLDMYEDSAVMCGMNADVLRRRILAIEAEAEDLAVQTTRAFAQAAEPVRALREALTELTRGMIHGEDCDANWDDTGSMLDDPDDSRCDCGLTKALAALAASEGGRDE